jgi:arginyl-tRNA synthetase
MQELKTALSSAAKDLFAAEIEPELTRPDEQFGDWATNVALQLGAKLQKNPREIAVALAAKLHGQPHIDEVNIAGPGFINIKLTDEALAKAALAATDLPQPNKGKQILVEFGDPNPFKEMHIGHLYSYIVGDSISRLLESSGASIRRLSYHGDVGLHVAKAIWGIQHSKRSANDSNNSKIGVYYVKGAKVYEENLNAKDEINEINRHIYKQDDEHINKVYQWGRDRSLSYFKQILSEIGVKTDKSYFESQAAPEGLSLVEKNKGKVFKQSDGAIIYEGEKAGLHTRVFITSKGLPTYETKDLGLANLKQKDFPKASRSIIITAHEQGDYFKVVLAALNEIDPSLAKITSHIPHGFISLSSGKMSSRTGEVYSATSLLTDVDQAVEKVFEQKSDATRNAAIKYGFLKHRLGSDIVYDVKESVSLDGNSGPYLQYAHARARSILSKASARISRVNDLEADERGLARKISEYPEVVQRAGDELLPSHIASYLYELAQTFNRFYEKKRVIGDSRQMVRVALVSAYADVLKNGLSLLNIEAPEHV